MTAPTSIKRKVDNIKFRMDTESATDTEYFEVQSDTDSRNKERIFISGINGVHSTAKLAQKMRDKKGVFLVNIREVQKNEEFRPCIERMKKDARDNNYEMTLIDNEWIMMLPKNAPMEMLYE